LLFVAVNDGISLMPFEVKPIDGLLFIHVKVPPFGILVNEEGVVFRPLHTA